MVTHWPLSPVVYGRISWCEFLFFPFASFLSAFGFFSSLFTTCYAFQLPFFSSLLSLLAGVHKDSGIEAFSFSLPLTTDLSNGSVRVHDLLLPLRVISPSDLPCLRSPQTGKKGTEKKRSPAKRNSRCFPGSLFEVQSYFSFLLLLLLFLFASLSSVTDQQLAALQMTIFFSPSNWPYVWSG